MSVIYLRCSSFYRGSVYRRVYSHRASSSRVIHRHLSRIVERQESRARKIAFILQTGGSLREGFKIASASSTVISLSRYPQNNRYPFGDLFRLDVEKTCLDPSRRYKSSDPGRIPPITASTPHEFPSKRGAAMCPLNVFDAYEPL